MYRLSRLMLILALLAVAFILVMVTIQFSGLVFFGSIFVIGIWAKRRGGTFTSFGTARFASIKELRDKKMLGTDTGIILGRVFDEGRPSFILALCVLFDANVPSQQACELFLASVQFGREKMELPDHVRLPRSIVHSLICAPTGVGKAVSIILPFLFSCRESVCCIDFKGELFAKTAQFRRRILGQRVIALDPFKAGTNSPDTLNPLDFIDKDSPTALDECRDLAQALVVRTGDERDPHWVESAILWITALIALVVFYGEPNDRSLQTVRTLLTNPERLAMAIQLMCSSDAWNGMLARLGGQLRNFTDKELNSTLTTTNRFLNFLDTQAVFESTKTSSFNPKDLLNGKLSIYLVLPPEHMRSQAPLLRMWVASLMRAMVRGGLQETNLVHFILDEFASIGKMEAIDDAVDKYRGYGVRLQFYVQSLSQLKKSFPDGQDQTLLSNVSQVYFGINDLPTAEYVSSRIGDGTIVIESGGSSSGTTRQSSRSGESSYSYSSNENQNWAQHGRRLLKPEEILALPQRVAIVFTPGVRPFWTKLIRYYEESFPPRGQPRSDRMKAMAKIVCFSAGLLVMSLAVAKLVLENHTNKTPLVPRPVPHRQQPYIRML